MEYQFHNLYKKNNRKNKLPKWDWLKTVSKLYKENKRFFFNVGSGNVNSPKGIIKYLGRYLARAPIAEYKIINYDNKKVTFFFNDLADNKKKKYVTMDIDKFVQQVLIHLPPKNFKMINRFGFYGRNISTKLKDTIKKYKKRFPKSEYFFCKTIYWNIWCTSFYMSSL